MLPSSVHLLRTLAAVPPSSRVLDLGCGDGQRTDALTRLGFDVYACAPSPADVAATRAAAADALGESAARRVTLARPAALGYPDDFFDWIVAHGAYDAAESANARDEMLAETRRVLKPGGWVWVALATDALGDAAPPEALTRLFENAGFALAEAPHEAGSRLLVGIYRKVGASTVR